MHRRSNSAGSMLIVFLLSCSACFLPDCSEVTLNHGQAADGVYAATAYALDCGAVGDFNLKVRLEEKPASGSTTRHEVLNLVGRFKASFDWPEARLLHVTVSCEQAGQCSSNQVEEVRKALASTERTWRELKIEYAVQ